MVEYYQNNIHLFDVKYKEKNQLVLLSNMSMNANAWFQLNNTSRRDQHSNQLAVDIFNNIFLKAIFSILIKCLIKFVSCLGVIDGTLVLA